MLNALQKKTQKKLFTRKNKHFRADMLLKIRNTRIFPKINTVDSLYLDYLPLSQLSRINVSVPLWPLYRQFFISNFLYVDLFSWSLAKSR